jgi:hypothetical protein
MTYLKEENKTRVQRGCALIFTIICISSLGIEMAIELASAVQSPSNDSTLDIGGFQVDQSLFSDFFKGGAALLIFSFIAHMLTSSIDGKAKLRMIFWPFKNATEDLECFVKKKGYSDYSNLSNIYPEAFSADKEPADRAKAWYDQVYLPVRDSNLVRGANKEFLYWRELYTFTVLLLALYSGSLILSKWLDLAFITWTGLVTTLVFTALLNFAARNASNTLIRNSLSEASVRC